MTNKNIPEDWQQLLKEYQTRIDSAQTMGGEEKLQKQKSRGKLNARELIQLFCDQDSFTEIGTLVGSQSYHGEKSSPADALVGGLATINQQSIVIAVEDFTVQGGSIGHGTNAKRVRLATMALQQKLPFIMLLDGAGARMSNGLDRHPYGPNDLQILAQLSGSVPTIAIVIGSSAGHSAVGSLLMDFVIMLESSCMFAAGPPLVAAATGETINKEELGGATMHTTVSGVAHNIAKNAENAASMLKNYLSFFQNRQQTVVSTPDKTDNTLLNLIPANLQTPYNIITVIQHLLDDNTWFEYQPAYGQAIVTGLGRLNGHSIAIIANQPIVLAGSIDCTAANKAADFITTVDNLGLPILFLADTPGIMSGSAAERAGTLRAAARMYKAQAEIRSPKLHVTLRKAFGFASSVMAMNPFDNQTISLALPGVSLGGLPVSGGAQAANIDKETEKQLVEAESSGAWTAGDALAYDEIIDPRQLRSRLINALEISNKKGS